jgi:hypothetical protein
MEYKEEWKDLEPPKYLFIEELAKPKPPSANVLEHKQCVGEKVKGVLVTEDDRILKKYSYTPLAPKGAYDDFISDLEDDEELNLPIV